MHTWDYSVIKRKLHDKIQCEYTRDYNVENTLQYTQEIR